MDDGERNKQPPRPQASPPRSQAIHRGSPTPSSSARSLVPPSRTGSDVADVESILRSWGADTSGVDDDASRTLLGGSFGGPNDAASLAGVLGAGWLVDGTGTGGSITSLGGGFADPYNLTGAGMGSSALDRRGSFDASRAAGASSGGGSGHRRAASVGGRLLPSATSAAPPPPVPPPPPQCASRGANLSPRSPAVLETKKSGSSLLAGGESALHDAARITDWATVLDLSRSNPDAAKYVGPDGWSALHHACDRRCPHVDVMEALLTAHPGAIVTTNDKGWTPLHRASRNKTPVDVVRLLLERYPELGRKAAGMRCGEGRSPLHYALLYDAPEGVVELLLRADPDAVLDGDRGGVTPLALVWDRYADGFEGKRTLQLLLRPFEAADPLEEALMRQRGTIKAAEDKVREALASDAPQCRSLRRRWERSNLLLRAYFRFPTESASEGGGSSRKWRALHAASAIRCHPQLFLLARAVHPDQALEDDEGDLIEGRSGPRTALHLAASSQQGGLLGKAVIRTLIGLNPEAAGREDGTSGDLPLHAMASNDRKLRWAEYGFQVVYDAHPEALSRTNRRGMTPLHCATARADGFGCALTAAHGSSDYVEPAVDPESIVQNLIHLDGGAAASVPDSTGRLPLHHLAERGESWDADARSLLAAHPQGASARSAPPSAQLPLHAACSNPGAHPCLLKGLVEAHPRAASVPDGPGRLPLHVAVSTRARWDDGVAAVHAAYPPAVRERESSSRGWTALHSAAASGSDPSDRSVIEKLVGLHPGSASETDGEGRTPLHLACSGGRSWDDGGVGVVFAADPSAALVADGHGMLPLHAAAMRGKGAGVSGGDASAGGEMADAEHDGGCGGPASREDIEAVEVMFNLLLAQPSTLQV